MLKFLEMSTSAKNRIYSGNLILLYYCDSNNMPCYLTQIWTTIQYQPFLLTITICVIYQDNLCLFFKTICVIFKNNYCYLLRYLVSLFRKKLRYFSGQFVLFLRIRQELNQDHLCYFLEKMFFFHNNFCHFSWHYNNIFHYDFFFCVISQNKLFKFFGKVFFSRHLCNF